MMHEGARTKFILEHLSQAIELSFSIRQGDPMAMVLYILYIEPLLLRLESSLKGINIAGIKETTEAYCDDVNVLTDDEGDLVQADVIVKEFEALSGAILSRSKKCKIIGFGQWNKKTTWPLKYIQTEAEVKIF